ncbi:MAG TPA: VOC family protein [Gemmatimonadaceae bacterium]
MPPTIANGKICYVELPAADVKKSAAFYSKVFGWNMRTRGDGAQAFDDTEITARFRDPGGKHRRAISGTGKLTRRA